MQTPETQIKDKWGDREGSVWWVRVWERKGRREAGELIYTQGPRPTQNFKDRSSVTATGTGAQERGGGGTASPGVEGAG